MSIEGGIFFPGKDLNEKYKPVDEVNRAIATTSITLETQPKTRSLDNWHSVRGLEMFALTSPKKNSRRHPYYCLTSTAELKRLWLIWIGLMRIESK